VPSQRTAVQDGTGSDDKHFTFATTAPVLGVQIPEIRVTVTVTVTPTFMSPPCHILVGMYRFPVIATGILAYMQAPNGSS
jgi:hypothetical protein